MDTTKDTRPTFTVEAIVYERDADGTILLDTTGQEPIKRVQRTLGSFVFAYPSFWDRFRIEPKIDKAMVDAGGWMRGITSWIVLLGLYYPVLIVKAPAGFDLEQLSNNDDIRALWEAIEEGLAQQPKK